MANKLILFPAIALVFLSTQACYTQLAWFHPPEPKEDQSTFSEYDPYGWEGLERSSDFEPSLYRGSRHYGYDPSFWSYYGNYGSPFGLYSPYGPYGGGRWMSPYGYTYYPYDVPGYRYGLTAPVIGNMMTQTPRNWDRGGGSDQTSSNLIVRRELSLSDVTAQPIRKQLPIPKRSFLISESRKQGDVSNGNYNKPSYRGNNSSSTWSRGSSYPSGRSISSGSSSGSSSSSSTSSSGRVTRRR